MGKAHLGYEVEVVFIDDDDLRLMPLRAHVKAGDGFREHGVEDRDGDTCLTQGSCGIERTQRRVRLHLPHLLDVIREMVRMCQKDICHRAPSDLNDVSTHWRTPWEVLGRLRATDA